LLKIEIEMLTKKIENCIFYIIKLCCFNSEILKNKSPDKLQLQTQIIPEAGSERCMQVDVLFNGFPGRSNRGFLGWSSCVLIQLEGESPILFDTVGFNERYVLIQKLANLGVRPEDIGSVFLSHFHFDHAVNYGLFPNATFYLHEREIEYVERFGREDLAVPYEMFPALKNSGRLSVLSGDSGVVRGLRWVLTPGHTPGLYSLFLYYRGERWVLASDAVKNELELLTGQVEMSNDPVTGRNSIERIRNWADVVVPGHDRLLRIQWEENQTTVQSGSKASVEIIIPQGTNCQAKTLLIEA
jgi:N-acyl homoserine lactone hydrolase